MLLNQGGGGGDFERNFFFFFSRVSNRPLHFARLGFCKIGGAPLEKKANNCQVPAPEQTIIRFGLGMNDDAEICVDKKKLPCFPLKVFSNTTETIAGI